MVFNFHIRDFFFVHFVLHSTFSLDCVGITDGSDLPANAGAEHEPEIGAA